MNRETFDSSHWKTEPLGLEERRFQADNAYLVDLIKALQPHPGGLRRWSVMRAIRKNREIARIPIPQKMEDAVERVFRNHCEDSESFKKRGGVLEAALFYWPQGKLGGVWAVYADRAEAWLKDGGACL